MLLHIPLNHPLFYCFIFGAVLFQYNLPYVVKVNTQKRQAGLISFTAISFHHWMAGLALIIVLVSFFILTFLQIVLFAGIGILTVIYSFNLVPFTAGKRLKDYGLVKILTLTILWVIITVVLPVINKPVATYSLMFLCVLRLFFLWVLCLLFDLRDISVDSNAGIRTIPVLLGKNKARLSCYFLTTVFLGLAIFFSLQTQSIFILNAYIISGAATFFIIRLTRNYTSPIFYLACVDGLMLLQATLIIIGSI